MGNTEWYLLNTWSVWNVPFGEKTGGLLNSLVLGWELLSKTLTPWLLKCLLQAVFSKTIIGHKMKYLGWEILSKTLTPWLLKCLLQVFFFQNNYWPFIPCEPLCTACGLLKLALQTLALKLLSFLAMGSIESGRAIMARVRPSRKFATSGLS